MKKFFNQTNTRQSTYEKIESLHGADLSAHTAVSVVPHELNQHSSIEILSQLAQLYNERNSTNRTQTTSPIIFLSKTILNTLAICSGIPYYSVASQFSRNPVLKVLLGLSACITLALISLLAVGRILSYVDLIRKATNINVHSELILGLSSIALGALSALPGALIVSKYGNPLLLPLSIFFDFSVNTMSFNEFFRQLYNDRFCYRDNSEVLQWRNSLIKHLEYGVFYGENPGETVSTDSVIYELRKAIKIAQTQFNIQKQHPNVFFTGLNSCVYSLSPILPLFWNITAGYLSYLGMRNWLETQFRITTPIFAIVPAAIIAAFSSLPSYFLEIIFARLLLKRGYLLIANKIYNVHSTSPMFHYYPKEATAALAITLFLISGAFAARARTTTGECPNGLLCDALLVGVILGTFLFKTSASIDSFFRLSNILLAEKTTHYAFKRQLLFENFQIILRIAPPEKVQALLPIFPEISENQSEDNASTRQGQSTFNSIHAFNNSVSFFRSPTPNRNRTYNAVEQREIWGGISLHLPQEQSLQPLQRIQL